MSKHTPGPWRVFERVSIIAEPDPMEEVLPVVAQVIDHRDGALDANARLVAAAPEATNSLEALLAYLGSLVASGRLWLSGEDLAEEPEVLAARAALAKAKGDTE